MNQNGIAMNLTGPGPGGQGPAISGKFFHKDTGREIFVRDSINDGIKMCVVLSDGTTMDMSEFQNYVQMSDEEYDSQGRLIGKAKEQPNQTQKQETKTVSLDSKKEDSKPVVKKPWEELGLSEDEYYNKPIMKWQKVTHANMDACKKEGQETIDDENNDYSNFWCYEVYSPSGKFLGAMLSLS